MKLLRIFVKSILGLIGLLVLLYITFYFMASGDYKVAQTIEHDPSIPHLTLDGITMHVETYGSDTNDVVIILHGDPVMILNIYLILSRLPMTISLSSMISGVVAYHRESLVKKLALKI